MSLELANLYDDPVSVSELLSDPAFATEVRRYIDGEIERLYLNCPEWVRRVRAFDFSKTLPPPDPKTAEMLEEAVDLQYRLYTEAVRIGESYRPPVRPDDYVELVPLCRCGHGPEAHEERRRACVAGGLGKDGCRCSAYRPLAAPGSM